MKHNERREAVASRALTAIVAACLGLAVAIGVSGCSFGQAANALYIYMCGSTLETKAGAGSKNIDELLEAEIPANTEVVIQTGGASKWRDHDIAADALSRYVVEGGELRLIETLDDVSMGDAQTLEDFLSWCQADYPAERETLVLWDHGGGSSLTLCYDENHSMDPLTPDELAAAFEGSHTHVDLLGLDACLMASLDTAALFSPYANYLISSEDIEPSGGWDYGAFAESLAAGEGTLETGRAICDAYLAKCQEAGKDAFATLSLMDLSKAADAQVAFEAFAQDLAGAVEAGDDSFSVASAARRATAFGANSPHEGYSNMIDLYGFADTIRERTDLASAGELCTALEELAPYGVEGSGRQEAGGVSLYYPVHYDGEKLDEYLGLTANSAYAGYLDAVYGEIPEATVAFADAGSVAEDGSFQIQLTPESRPYLQSVDFFLLELQGADPARPTAVSQLGSDSDVSYDWDALTFNSNFRGLWPALEGVPLNSTCIGSSGETLLFTAPVEVNGERTNLRFAYVWDDEAGGHYEALGLWDGLDEYALAEKEMRPLEPGDEVVVLSRVLDGATGTSSNDVSGQSELVAGETVTIPDGGATITEVPLDGTNYQYLFVVRDIFGNVFTSEPAIFKMAVTPEQLMSDEVIDRAYAADVVSVGGKAIAVDDEAVREDE